MIFEEEGTLKDSFFVRTSFLFVSFIIPLAAIFGFFLALIPQEQMKSKPPLSDALLGLAAAGFAWVVLVPIFVVGWTLLMRLIYGKRSVIQYFNSSSETFPGPLQSIENAIQKICHMVL